MTCPIKEGPRVASPGATGSSGRASHGLVIDGHQESPDSVYLPEHRGKPNNLCNFAATPRTAASNSGSHANGFTERPALAELAKVARARNIPLIEDLGSGAIVDLRSFGINGEPNVVDSLHAEVDVVTYSGDKLLGGPQAGLLSGRADLIARMRKNSLFRALRVDKLTYAAMAATLLAYVKHDHAAIPALRMMHLTRQGIAARAETLVEKLRSTAPKWDFEIVDGESVVGGGAAPSAVLPTRLIAVALPGSTADWLSARLRRRDPPIVSRVEDGRVLLDLRTVFPEQDRSIADAIQSI